MAATVAIAFPGVGVGDGDALGDGDGDGLADGLGDGPTFPVHVVPLRVNADGLVLLPDHEPLNPKETEALVAMEPL
ncbi:hypothetical protein GCM10009677_44510 [Sphaerisporangium rubeum]